MGRPAALLVPIGAQALNAGKAPFGRARWLLTILLAIALAGICACGHEPPEEALRATIAGMQAAAEGQDTDAMFEPIAEDFAGNEGMDKKTFHRYVTFMGMRNKNVGVQLGPLDVKLFDQRATVSFTAAITGGAGLLPEHGQVYRVETGWRMDDGEWKLISAKWKEQL